jgi:hypothetical protein
LQTIVDELIQYKDSLVLSLGPDVDTLNPLPKVILQYPLKKNSSWADNYGMTYKVVAFVSLSVPAGTFHNVCKVVRIHGWKEEAYSYYAPNVGLIFTEVIEANGPTTPVETLTSYKQE